MSQEQPQPAPKVNPLSFIKQGRGDQRMQGIVKLLTSDKDNETKTRIPNVLGMTFLDWLGALSSPNDFIVVRTADEAEKTKEVHLPKTVEGLAIYFGMRYRINAISKAPGLSRLEYVDALKSYLAAQAEVQQGGAQARAEEGVKKKN